MPVSAAKPDLDIIVTDLLSSPDPHHRKELLHKLAAIAGIQFAVLELIFVNAANASSKKAEVDPVIKPVAEAYDNAVASAIFLTSSSTSTQTNNQAQDFLHASMYAQLAKLMEEMETVQAELQQVTHEVAVIHREYQTEQPVIANVSPRPQPVAVDAEVNNHNPNNTEVKLDTLLQRRVTLLEKIEQMYARIDYLKSAMGYNNTYNKVDQYHETKNYRSAVAEEDPTVLIIMQILQSVRQAKLVAPSVAPNNIGSFISPPQRMPIPVPGKA